jgi:hypothetical protein
LPKPICSVLIDTYNHERFIEKAVVSVLEQDFPADEREIVVIDDGSTDATAEIVRKFEPHVRYIRKSNGGQASAFNAAIPECHGDILAFLDGDDYWLPGKLVRIADVFEQNPAVGFVGHGIRESLPDGTERISSPANEERFRLNSVPTAKLFRLRKSYMGTSRMAMRADLARTILPVPDSLVFEADEYLFTLAAAMSDVVILREPLTCYVIHGANLFVSSPGMAGLRRKQQVLAALATALTGALQTRSLPREVIECVVEIIRAEADQLRLMLDGGAPWETVRTENTLFNVLHADASGGQRLFRALSMVPAMTLPPRWFYACRQWLGNRSLYRQVRLSAFPVPPISAVPGPENFKH